MVDRHNDKHIDDDIHCILSRQALTSDETIASITLRSTSNDERDNPVLIVHVVQHDRYQLASIQLLSNARHIEVKEILTRLRTDTIFHSTRYYL
jgi:hypothetical protein